jgi:hypothetical protein
LGIKTRFGDDQVRAKKGPGMGTVEFQSNQVGLNFIGAEKSLREAEKGTEDV